MKDEKYNFDRRAFLQLTASGLLGLVLSRNAPGHSFEDKGNFPSRVEPLPLEAVRLKPSPFLDAVSANLKYLHKLEPDRLLHNFRKHAGLKPKGELYGGWEKDTIAGHSLGHYLTACALIYAQTGDAEMKKRVDYIVGELAECQRAAGDGYVAGFTRKKGDAVEDGRVVFDEIARGEIRSAGFDLNGCWVPLYNWHKLFSGLFEAQTNCKNVDALKVAVDLAGYIERVFAKINDEQLQKVLNCEHGGINESFAELYARTNEQKWLALAERIRHRRVLDPMFAQKDELSNIHANTQIPKVIGLARLFELTEKPEYGVAANFFWRTVTTKYSYVIGGNADREYFQLPNTISKHITEQTCESCNTYNMLKLTRHLFAWNPQAEFFDYYERAHFNHMLAHQNPRNGMFAYMIPLMSGTKREFSSEFNDFWCCVGSGMESHSKHGESIYWQGANHLIVNLYIPSALDWREQNAKFELATDYPRGEEISFSLTEIAEPKAFSVSLRIPAWCENAALKINGKLTKIENRNGYATARRKWKKGDSVVLNLPQKLRFEPTPDDPNVIAFLKGPLVLAADLGASEKPYEKLAPVLVGADLVAAFAPSPDGQTFKTRNIGRPQDYEFKPFYSQWDNRTAVYFRRFTDAQWKAEEIAFAAEQARLRDLEARTLDVMYLGEMQPERDHRLESKISYPVSYRGRNGRDARTGGFFEFTMKVRDDDAPLVLRAAYWGEERRRTFYILIDGKRFATETLNAEKPGEFIERDYPIPSELIKGKTAVVVRFEPETGNTAGPVFGCRIYAAKS